jgi:hypothetical protein
MSNLQAVTDSYNASVSNTALASQVRNTVSKAQPFDYQKYAMASAAFDNCKHAQDTSEKILQGTLAQNADIAALLAGLEAANTQMAASAEKLAKDAAAISKFADDANAVVQVLSKVLPFFI